MKKVVMGVLSSHEKAERLIHQLREGLHVPLSDISYVYKNAATGEVIDSDVIEHAESSATPDVTTGAVMGATMGTLAGVATVMGVIPVIGPIFAAGPLIAMLGIGGAIGTTATAALTGAMAGGFLGALIGLGAPQEDAAEYEKHVASGDILIAVHADSQEDAILRAFTSHEASLVRSYTAA